MKPEETHIRHCLLYEFRKGSTASIAFKNISSVYSESGLSLIKCQRWFRKFKNGNFDILETRGGSSSNFDDGALLKLIEEDPKLTTRELGDRLQVSHTTVATHLHQIGKVNKEGSWVPHNLNESNKQNRLLICSSLLSRFKKENFLKRIVTGDEKWVFYINIKRKKQWLTLGQKPIPTSKAGLHPRRIMMSVWWDYRGVIYYELLPQNEMITGNIYCHQLERLKAELEKVRPGLINRNNVIIQQDNARPHTSKLTLQKLRDLDWEVLPHPAYSPDIAPSDYHLFRSLQNYLIGKEFVKEENIKSALDNFFASKSSTFYEDGIMTLPLRWQKVIDNNGNYFD